MRRAVGRNLRYLVTVADDFGRSLAINRAVADACDKGVLAAASIMPGGEAFKEAVRMADERTALSVGLHVTLCDGRAVLPHARIPGLTTPDGFFRKNPVAAWMSYLRRGLLPEIEMEIAAQFDRLQEAGIRPTHVDCHHHLHMHPIILEAVCRQASKRGVLWVRMPREPLSVVLGGLPGRGIMPYLEWMTFGALQPWDMRIIRKHGMRTVHHTYGLSYSGNMDEDHLVGILEMAAGPIAEIFFHPDLSTESGRKELAALTSPLTRDRLEGRGVTLAGYRDLSERAVGTDFSWERS